ncbi:hypothetical protein GCM10010172_48800 [Paractinoplanes ferrugineus]|uniref:DUF11 domain-containing protein n=1 Tax=Paractinoplanes ferrugineus TaxID=113564 RepID=A0A919IY05_9ACTN|nr:DUF11 domain-containing protein [Actinoplanes ferrugineus]GIE11141.1 hypothetical protein Afe05nite_29810 [Actinoplanes ferrugineus]
MVTKRPARGRRLAVLALVAVLLALVLQPTSASAATQTTTAQFLSGSIRVLNLPGIDLGLLNPGKSWTTGGNTASSSLVNANLTGIGSSVLNLGAVSELAGPVTGGGRAEAKTAGVTLLGSGGITTGPITAGCRMTNQDITPTVEIANLQLGGKPVAAVTGQTGIDVPGIATVDVGKRTATYSGGVLTYTVKALDVTLLQGALGLVANSALTLGKATCAGTVQFGATSVSGTTLAPGESGTPTVTVTNVGDVAAPNTTITIPLPADPSLYALGAATVTGGGPDTKCVADSAALKCTGVTVPGKGSVQVNLPVTLVSSAPSGAAAWSTSGIDVTSVPAPDSPAVKITATGSGTLVTTKNRASTGGSISVTPKVLAAGKTITGTVTVGNDGPSDASASVLIPIDNLPAGVNVLSATGPGSTSCTVNTGVDIRCTGVPITATGTAAISVRTEASVAATPGATVALSAITANLNGTTVGGQGTLFTIDRPDVNLNGGVVLRPVTATPGGAQVTATVRVTNAGQVDASPTTITLPAPPAGYTIGAVTTNQGGTCTAGAGGITCTDVIVPGGGTTVVSIPVKVGSAVTADWIAPGGTPVTASAGGTQGTQSGPIVALAPSFNLSVDANAPADGTVSPGGTATMRLDVANQGPSNATNASFVVIAPDATTFGPLTGTGCAAISGSATQARCTVSLTGGGATSLSLPLVVNPLASPALPITGGCVSLDNDTLCTGPTDSALPSFTLRTPLANRLSTTLVPTVITPGGTGTGQVRLTSIQAETGLSVTIPLSGLPTDFTIQSVTAPGAANCTFNTSTITCTGVALAANTPGTIGVVVAANSGAQPLRTWTPTVTVAAGTDQASRIGALAGTGTGNYTLAASFIAPPSGQTEPGGTAPLQVKVDNNGPSNAASATFTVKAPTGTSFASVPSNCTTVDATAAVCTRSLAAGASTGPLSFPLVVDPNANPDNPVSGGCVDLDGIPGCGPGDAAIPSFTLKVPFAAKAIVTVDPATVTPGDLATAVIHVKAGHGALTGATVTAPTAGLNGLTIDSVRGPAGSTCTSDASQLQCTNVAIADGATGDISVTVKAPAAGTPGTTWTTGITVAAGGESGTTAGRTVATIGVARPKLTAAVALGAGSGSLLPGQSTSVDVAVGNQGPSDATNATFTVLAPAGSAFTGSAPAGCVFADARKTRATCTVANLAAGPGSTPYSLPLKVDLTANPGQPLVGGCVDLDGDGVCTVADAPIPALTVGIPAQQRITVAAVPASVTPGRTANAKITVSSPRAETGLKVTVPLALPAGLTVNSGSWPGGHNCTVNAGGDLECASLDIAGAATPTVLTVPVTAAASMSPAVWTATGLKVTDSTGDVAVDSAVLAVVGAAQTSLSAVVSVPVSTTDAGSTANVNITVHNGGPSDATNAVVTVDAPVGTTFGSLAGTPCLATTSTLATCQVTAAVNGADGFTLPVRVPANADVTTPLTGGCVNLDGVPGCGGPDEQPIGPIHLTVGLDRRVAIAAVPAVVPPGGTADAKVRITATYDNLTGVTVKVPLADLPAALHATADWNGTPCNPAGGQLVCTGLTVNRGATQDVLVHLTADANAVPDTTWTATGISVDDGGAAITATRLLATAGSRQYALGASIAAVTPVTPGQIATLPVTAVNLGPSDAVNASFTVVAPAGAGFDATQPAGCTSTTPYTTVSCPAGSLAAGASTGVYQLKLKVDSTADPATPLTGGCFDGDNDGRCTSIAAPPDVKLPDIALAVPFAQQVSVTSSPFTPVDPTQVSTGAPTVTIATSGDQNLHVTIPLTGLPAHLGLDGNTPPGATAGGICVVDPGVDVDCTGIANTGGPGGTATITVPVEVGANTPATEVWNPTIVISNGTDTVSAPVVIARGDTPTYTLHASFDTGAADDTLPGGTARLGILLTNSGSDVSNAPVIVQAPTGTTFGTPTGLPCTRATPILLTCQATVTTANSPVTWTVPVLVPAATVPGATIGGGCVDLDGDGGCDTTIASFTAGRPLTSVLGTGGTGATVTPGGTGTGTVTLSTTDNRTGLTVAVDTTTGLPSGLHVTGVSLGGSSCPVDGGGVARCPGTTGTPATLTFAMSADPDAQPGDTWSPAITVTKGAETAVLRRVAATVGAAVTALRVDVDVPGSGVVLPGDTAYLLVTMTNNGPSAMPGAHARFKAPDGTTFAALDAPASDYCTALSATVVSCTTDLGVGAKSFVLGVDTPATATAGGTLSGGCYDRNEDGLCDDPADEAFAGITLGKPFAVQAVLTVEGGTVAPGATGTGYLTLTADRALSGLRLDVAYDELPSSLTVTAASTPAGRCTVAGQLTCTGLRVDQAGTARLVTVSVRASASAPVATTWTPARMTLSNPAGDTSVTTGTVMTTTAATPGLHYTLTAPSGPVRPGDEPAVALTVTNTGPSDATGVVARVRAPAGTTFAALDPVTASACAPVGLTSTLLDCAFNLAVGGTPKNWALPVRIPSNADPGSVVTGGCADLDRDSACTDPPDELIPDLHLTPTLDQALTLTGSDTSISPGTSARALVRITSTRNAAGLTVTIPLATLPAGLSVPTGPAAATSTAATGCTVNATAVTCTGVSLVAGVPAVVGITVTARDTATPNIEWKPTVTITGAGDSVTRPPLLVAHVGPSNVSVKVTAAPPATGTLKPGDTGQVVVTAVNSGTSYASGLNYSIKAPAHTTFVAPTGTTASFCRLTTSTRVDCTLAVGGNGVNRFNLGLTVDPGADANATVSGGCVDADGDGACTGPADSPIAGFKLYAPISGDSVTVSGTTVSVTPGLSGTGSIRITSVSAIASATVTIPLSTLPAGFKATGAIGPTGSVCTPSATRIQCTSVALAAGATTTIAVVTTVAAGVAPGTIWAATGITVAAGPDTVSGTADLILAGPRSARVTFSVAGPEGTVAPGETTSLTVTGVNSGPSYAVNSTATVNAPTNATFGPLTGVTASACRVVTTTQLSCTYTLEAGNTLTWTLPLKVSPTARTGDKVANGCVSADGDTRCGGSQDVDTGQTPVAEPLATNGSLSLGGAVVGPGSTGTATITLSATADYTDLVLTVPMDDLPAGFTVNSAALGPDSCTVGSGSIVCSGVALTAGTTRSLRLSVTVSPSISTAIVWRATGVTLVPAGDPADKLTSSGILISTTPIQYAVTVSTGAVSVSAPRPGETTILPLTVSNAGPGDADPYPVTIVIPDGASHGTLPAGCTEGDSARIVVCQVSLKAGDSAGISLPLVVDAGIEPGTVVTGGCVDQALSTGTPTFDYTCGGTADVAIPRFTVGRYDVDLSITYGGGAVPVAANSRPVVRIPYVNAGTTTAADVSFTVEPPPGVWIAKAEILLDGSATQRAARIRDRAKKVVARSTVEATCTKVTTGDANDVACAAPNAAADSGSELWLTLMLGAGVEAGTHAMTVTVTTTSADGLATNNTVDVPLVLTAQDTDSGNGGNGGNGGLPTTGADVARLGLLSAILVAFGLVLLAGARPARLRPAAAAVRRRASRRPRHARPTFLRRVFRKE